MQQHFSATHAIQTKSHTVAMELYVRSILPQIMHLPTNDTSDSQNIAARVKERRRPVKKKQKQPRPAVTALDSPGSTQHK